MGRSTNGFGENLGFCRPWLVTSEVWGAPGALLEALECLLEAALTTPGSPEGCEGQQERHWKARGRPQGAAWPLQAGSRGLRRATGGWPGTKPGPRGASWGPGAPPLKHLS